MTDYHDYIVIGGGSAGSVVAGRLSSNGASVLVLEAGGTDKRMDVRIPGAVASVYKTANWKYPVEPDETRTGAKEAWMAGKILGGGGSINSCVYVRGNPADFDGWAALGCNGWSFADVLPAFKRMESWQGGANAFRGGDGPINVVEQSDRGIANSAFYASAQEAGFAVNEDYNADHQDGVSWVQVNHRRGRRSQASWEYLRNVARKDRLSVVTDAWVARILFDGNRATGVEYLHQGQIKNAFAGKEVILSAGAMASPKILKLSGIGPRDELSAVGIDVVEHAPGVGSNLHDHGFVMQRWHAKGVRTMNKMSRWDMLKGVAEYVLRGTGFLAMTVVPVQVMAKSSAMAATPDLQLQFAPFSLSRNRNAEGMYDVELTKEEGFWAASSLLQPLSRGRVQLRSGSFQDPALISYPFFQRREDLSRTLAGMSELRNIMSQPAMQAITTGPMEPEAKLRTQAEWESYARLMMSSSCHPVGTCKMGSDDMAVVDPELNVHGVKSLRVVDASIMPTITSGNTNAPAMMIGERAAELILAQ